MSTDHDVFLKTKNKALRFVRGEGPHGKKVPCTEKKI